MDFGEDMESNVDFHIKDEAKRMLKEIELVKKNVENSEFYTGMHLDLKQNKTIQKHFFCLLGSHTQVQVVIYGLGSIEYSFSSQFQLAVALLLKRDFFNWIGNIKIYDPCLSPADIIVFEKLDLKVLTIDENCKRRVQRPTMFYMPYPHCYLIGNVLGANWSSSCLSQIYLLTNSFRSTLSDMPRTSQLLETVLRLERILHFTAEIDMKTSDDKMYADVFSGFAWHFFDVDPNIHIDIDKLGCYWLDMQRHLEEEFLEYMEKDIMTSMLFAEFFGVHRLPRRLRCNPVPPPPGWIKLNIYGIGTKGDQPGQYSGIFHDEKGKCFDRYRGDIDIEDNVIAGLEALKIGLAGCVEGRPNAQKIYLLTNSFRSTLSDMPRTSQLLETVLRLERILHFTAEIDIKTSDDKMLFSGFAWHFFDVDPNIHIDIGKLGCYWLDMQRHIEEEFLEYMENDIMTSMLFAEFLGDHPRRLRCNPVPPPPGWIKLDIYGIGIKGDQPGQYSGIFHDEKGKCFDRYRGDIDVEDNVIAGLEALKIGLAGCVEGRPNAQKLIVESDNVILVHYVNGLIEPNETRLKEIFDLLKRITCAVYHIYEETNETARDLALRG